jgi:23S rRNA (adenine2503-C2)-methyltransferase
MTDLPAADRARLVRLMLPQLLTEAGRRTADGGATVKTLYRLFDGEPVETVLMAYASRTTLCVSSQAGCGMGCPFCATGGMGLRRNLSAGEILEQVRLATMMVDSRRLSNIVFMGMGEPLANYAVLLRALHGIADRPPNGFGISARSITVSTCGLLNRVDQLSTEGLPVRLALSLHAPDDELRDRLVPINRRYGVAATLAAVHRYWKATRRRVSIEYALIRGINDQEWRAAVLAERLCQYGTSWVHLNPIPLNPVPGSIWTASRPKVQDLFVTRLEQAGLTVTLRDTRGQEIDGACGQLAAGEGNN